MLSIGSSDFPPRTSSNEGSVFSPLLAASYRCTPSALFFVLPSLLARSFSLDTTCGGKGSTRNWSRVTNHPVSIDIIFTDPDLFPVGSTEMQSSVRPDILLSVFGTVHWQKNPNPTLKSSSAVTARPGNSSRGLARPLLSPTFGSYIVKRRTTRASRFLER